MRIHSGATMSEELCSVHGVAHISLMLLPSAELNVRINGSEASEHTAIVLFNQKAKQSRAQWSRAKQGSTD